ncbi:MAG: T9SS type A sorting domain-containing protein [Ignavibacteriae bacterium]|nr:T9SS type A sorting domain-containing protein [Ignavibacteriota bacterium]MCB9243183.1 T9SS type A sorting domain-containing protein [Ignavibacteriales bacterium]
MKRNFYNLYFIFFITIILTGTLQAQVSRHFSWLHPKPQGQSIRNVFTIDQNKWYGVTLSGDFIRTIDGGASWTITDNIGGTNLSTGNPFALYDLNMFDEKTGVICGEDGLLARTTTAGVTWEKFSVPDDNRGIWYDFFFVNAKTGFVGGESRNGIKMTTDAGLHWSDIHSPNTNAFSIFAFDANNIYTSSDNGKVFFTEDGGETWNAINTGSNDTLWKINFYDKQTAVACGTSNTVMLTKDRGRTWNLFTKNLPENTWYDIDFQTDETSTAVSESFASESFPPDGWSSFSYSGSSMWERSTVSPNLTPACAWSNFDPVMGDNVLLTPELEITAGDQLVFYLRRSYTGTIFNWDSLEVFVSARGGNTTRHLEPLMRIGVNSIDTSLSTYPPRIGTYKKYVFQLDKYAGNIVQAGFRHKNSDGTGVRLDEILLGSYRSKKLQRVYLTGNKVNVYRNTVSPFVSSKQPWMPVSFINSGQVYKGNALSTVVMGEDSLIVAGTNGLINKSYSSTGNQSYSDRNTDNNLYDLWTNSSGAKIISVGSSGDVLTSNNGGQSWEYNNISERSLYSISMVDDNTGWIAGAEGYLYRTTDGGVTWDRSVNHKAINLVFNDFREINFVDPKVGWAFGQNGAIIKTTSGGDVWTKQNSNLAKDITIHDSYMLNRSEGVFVGEHGVIEKTTNGGEKWIRLNYNNPNTDLRSVFMFDSNNGWICGTKGVLLKTSDGGDSWTSVELPYPYTDLYGVQFIDSDNGIVVGESGKTFRTTDGGVSWEFENSGATDHYSIQMLSPEISYISSSTGNIIMYNSRVETSNRIVFRNEQNSPDKLTLEQNYPNPFNPTTNISFSIPQPGNISLKVYDLAGREIISLINNELLNSGTYSKSFNGENLASGVYFYSLQINGKVSMTRKMLLVK